MLKNLVLFLASVATACGGTGSGNTTAADGAVVAAAEPRALQLNDVSILFPLGPTGLLSASAAGARGALLPSAIYTAAGSINGGTYADLRVVALRLDPCFATTAPDPAGTGCDAQMRLVMQPIDARGRAADSALHLFYTLSRAELLALAQSIVDARVTSSAGERLGALARHPIMVRQGLGGAMAKAVSALILQYAGQQNLTRVTEMIADDQDFWQFTGFDISAAARLAPMVIPTLPNNATRQRFNKNRGGGLAGNFAPATQSGDTLSPLVSGNARAAGVAAIARIDNPKIHTPNTIDCAGCHLATPALVADGLRESDSAFAFAADGTNVLAGELEATLTAGRELNVHAFSYLDTQPGISQRVVNESAAIVAYLNAL